MMRGAQPVNIAGGDLSSRVPYLDYRPPLGVPIRGSPRAVVTRFTSPTYIALTPTLDPYLH